MLQEEMEWEPGSMFVISGVNSVHWIALFYAFLYRGCACVPLDITLTTDSMRYVIQSTEAKMVFTTHEYISKFRDVLNSELCSTVERIILYDDGKSSVGSLEETIVLPVPFILLDTLVDEIGGEHQVLDSKDLVVEIDSPDHPLLLIHTSGSTGVPKGVVHSHSFYLSSIKKQIFQDVVMFLHSPLALSSSHSLLLVILRSGGRVGLRSSPVSDVSSPFLVSRY